MTGVKMTRIAITIDVLFLSPRNGDIKALSLEISDADIGTPGKIARSSKAARPRNVTAFLEFMKEVGPTARAGGASHKPIGVPKVIREGRKWPLLAHWSHSGGLSEWPLPPLRKLGSQFSITGVDPKRSFSQ